MGAEFLTIFWRDMIKFFRLRVMLVASLIQPVLWLALFGMTMSSNIEDMMPAAPPIAGAVSVSYLTFMSAGIIAMTILFTCLYSGMFLQLDRQYGLLKEMIASPMPRPQILFGLTLSGIVKSLLQVFIIIAFGMLLGVALFDGFTGAEVAVSLLGIILFVVLFAMGLMSLSNIIALKIESHEGVQGVITMLTLPLFFASNALYPLDSLPLALKVVAYINPITHFINGVRYFSLGTDFVAMGTEYSFGTNDLLIALAYLIGFNIVMYMLSIQAIKKAKVT